MDDHKETSTRRLYHCLSRHCGETSARIPSPLGDTSRVIRTRMTCTPSLRPQLERGANAVLGHQRHQQAPTDTKREPRPPTRRGAQMSHAAVIQSSGTCSGADTTIIARCQKGELNFQVTLIPLHLLPQTLPFHGLTDRV